jgi:hypothetical protein
MISIYCFGRMPISFVSRLKPTFLRMKLTSIVKNETRNFVKIRKNVKNANKKRPNC